MRRLRLVLYMFILCCIGMVCAACGSDDVAPSTALSETEIYTQDGEFRCGGFSWGMSPDEAKNVMQLIPFLEDNKVQGNSGSERTYYIPQDTVVDVSFYGSTYKVKPLYEFESEKLKNVSYTFSDLSELNNDEFLEKLSQDFGAYEEKSIDAPSGDKIYQYDWVKETTKCTYSATFFEEQLTVVSINVMKLD